MIRKIYRYIKKFFSLHFPEQLWIILHISKANKAYKISKRALEIANQHIKDPDLDGDYSGGMVDAFRHCLWMAMITQQLNEKIARSLGKVHEKGNYIDYKKKILEEGKLPDYISSKMDLLNNEVGITIAKKYPKTSEKQLIKIVKKAVIDGWCWKIKKDENLNFLNSFNNVIPPEQWKGKWINPKLLIPSDFVVFKL